MSSDITTPKGRTMKKYSVTFHYSVEIEAEDEATAEEQAWSKFGNPDFTSNDDFSTTVEEKIEVLPEQTSTVDDIMANSVELTLKAEELITKWEDEEDWWENVTVGRHNFDINIFYWKNDEGDSVRIATAHPVAHDGTGYGVTDMSNFVRLIVKKVGA
jgi:hypothetical protein